MTAEPGCREQVRTEIMARPTFLHYSSDFPRIPGIYPDYNPAQEIPIYSDCILLLIAWRGDAGPGGMRACRTHLCRRAAGASTAGNALKRQKISS